MITAYTGTPRGGKTFHAVDMIFGWLTMMKKPVFSNIDINTDYVRLTPLGRIAEMLNRKFKWKLPMPKRRIGKFELMDIYDMKPSYFFEYAEKNLEKNRENQCLIVIDEASLILNPRMDRHDRLDWIRFFKLHGHYGFTIILVDHHLKLLDRQISYLIEYDEIHLSLRRYKFLGRVIAMLLGGQLFVVKKKWVSINEKISTEILPFKPKIKRCYNTFQRFKVGLESERGIKKNVQNKQASPADEEVEVVQYKQKVAKYIQKSIEDNCSNADNVDSPCNTVND